MAYLQSSYPSGGSVSQVWDDRRGDLSPLLALLRRGQPSAARPASVMGSAVRMPIEEKHEKPFNLQDEQFKSMQRADAIKQMQAKGGLAPSKYVTVDGQTFLTQDPDAMNGYQRHEFLPNSSTQEGGFGPGAASTLPNDSGPSVMGATNVGADPTQQYVQAFQDEARGDAEAQAQADRAAKLRQAYAGRL